MCFNFVPIPEDETERFLSRLKNVQSGIGNLTRGEKVDLARYPLGGTGKFELDKVLRPFLLERKLV